MPTLRKCTRCLYVSSQEVCKACVLLEGLNKGLPKLGIGKSSKAKKILQENEEKNNSYSIESKRDNANTSCLSKNRKCLCTESFGTIKYEE